MLYAVPAKKRSIDRIAWENGALYLYSDQGMHRMVPMGENCVRITYTERAQFSNREKPGVVAAPCTGGWSVEEQEDEVILKSSGMCVSVRRETGSCTFRDASGSILLKERDHESKLLEEFQAYRIDETDVKTERITTADGEKELVRDPARIPTEKLYHTRTYFDWQEGEALYGLGQQEEGYLNLRGHVVYVHQANRKIAVPMLVSSLGYGLLMDTYSPMIFHDTEDGSYLYTEADAEIDYYFMAGRDMNDVVREYRHLTGKAAMLPKWAFGYLQSQERYETQDEILKIADEHRNRHIGLDCLVLDWCSWEDGMWGQKSLDPKRFPDPAGMIRKLHDKDIHFMLSIWPNMSKDTENYKEMRAAGCMLPASEIYNALDPKARALYWEQVTRALYVHGIDAWWCDSSEPLTVEWTHIQRMEPGILFAEYCRELQNILPAWETNVFPFYHAKTLFDGQTAEDRRNHVDRRVCNLTRSAYTGQQRFGTILWSGDTSASWDTLRSQIASGLNFVATGLPYWTVDIGAFFVKKSIFWYWDGEYNDTVQDAGYLELYTRWYQWAAFLPVFRGHGTDCRRELWEYSGENGMFYEAMLTFNRLRYRLMPYIYSQAGKVWKEDASLMKMLAFDFAADPNVLDIWDQYLFGDSMMVCPVTEPMYYTAGNQAVENACFRREVYLPAGCGWYDYWTGAFYEGGQWIATDAPIDRIPLFVREGSILPVTEATEHVLPEEPIHFLVYAGCDCDETLYRDSGDGYGYEQGEYTCTTYHWSEVAQQLTDDTGTVIDCEIIHR